MINENVLKIITSTVLSADKNEAITRRQKKVQFFFKYYVMFGRCVITFLLLYVKSVIIYIIYLHTYVQREDASHFLLKVGKN